MAYNKQKKIPKSSSVLISKFFLMYSYTGIGLQQTNLINKIFYIIKISNLFKMQHWGSVFT